MLAFLSCTSQKASTESSQISIYLNASMKLGIWETPMLLQALSQLKYSLTLNKSLAKWSLLNPAEKWIRVLELNQRQRAWQIPPHLNCAPSAASSVETNKPHCFRGKKIVWQAIKCCQVNNLLSWRHVMGEKFSFSLYFVLLIDCLMKSHLLHYKHNF